MNSKISIVLLVVCAVQGLQANLMQPRPFWPRPAWSNSVWPRPAGLSSPYNNRFPGSCLLNAYNAMIQAFQQAQQPQQPQQPATPGANNQTIPPEVRLECMKENHHMMQKLADDLEEYLKMIEEGFDKEEGVAEIRPQLHAEKQQLIKLISGTPASVAGFIDSGNIQGANNYFQNSRDQVTVHVENMMAMTEGHVGKDTPLNDQAIKLGNEVQMMGFTGAQAYIGEIQKCIENRTSSKAKTH